MAGLIISDVTIYYLSEHAVTVQFGDLINDELTGSVNSFNKLLLANPFYGFRSAVPAYNTLGVFFDPVVVHNNITLPGSDCFEKVSGYLMGLLKSLEDSDLQNADTIEIPVCYEGEYGPDLDDLTDLNGLTTNEIIKLHSEAVYTVGMIGFVPGFAYLTGLNGKLEAPRKKSPRKAIPAGSVGIAGMQTGIYSLQTPGGWQIIGRTPLNMFDASRKQPSLLKNGDKVIFKPISTKEFEHLTHTTCADQHS